MQELLRLLEPCYYLNNQIIVDEGEEVMQVTFPIDCKLEIGFRSVKKEFEFTKTGEQISYQGKAVYFLETRATTVNDYECLFSKSCNHVVRVKELYGGKDEKGNDKKILAYYIRAYKWR